MRINPRPSVNAFLNMNHLLIGNTADSKWSGSCQRRPVGSTFQNTRIGGKALYCCLIATLTLSIEVL
jgi:hypothetical protein